jgi:hypothetical protein
MIGCNQKKYQCGIVIPSACVPYTGTGLTSISNPSLLGCDANINDVITVLDGVLAGQVAGNNLTGLNPQCLSFDPATITPAGLHQIEINEICGLEASLTALQTQVNELNIGTMLIGINMQCLTPAASPCLTPPNTYELIAVLNTMLTEICAIKAYLGI